MIGFLLLLLLSCSLPPTVENVNKIFESQDFTLAFIKQNVAEQSLSFANGVMVYKSDQPTYRREVTYDEVVLINDFIQNIVNLHSSKLDPETSSHYVIKNTAYKIVVIPDQEDFHFEALIKTLKLRK